MKKSQNMLTVMLITLFVATGPMVVQAQEEVGTPNEFGAVIMEGVGLTATVEAVDKEKKQVTLVDKGGNSQIYQISDLVRNFDQIEVGDTVNITYKETVAIAVIDAATEPVRQDAFEITGAPIGDKPAGTIKGSTQVYAAVEEINYEDRTVVLKGPKRTIKVKVDDTVEKFNQIKQGDTVFVKFTELVAVEIVE